MHPLALELNKKNVYYKESDCFTDDPFHLVNTYVHANYNIKMHSHQFFEINIVVGGEGRHYIGDTSLPACVGDVFVIPPEVFHGYHTSGSLDICHIILRSSFMTRYREELALMPGFSLLFDIEPRLRRSAGCSCNLHIAPYDLSDFFDEVSRIIRAEESKHYAYQSAQTLALIGRLGELLQKNIENSSLPSQLGDLLLVMNFIQDNIDKKLTLDEIAAKANMSRSTLNRHFRQALHISPMQYLMHCRVTRARDLIAASTLSKTEIALLTGFYDVAHMNKYL
ncbi:MAG: helix-turn-helix domain-containing protein [Clostridia bacterium]|nr:helix-turn-helix domain-containing protein [Clostridia bacterium]